MTSATRRWRFGWARRVLRPANRWALDAWVSREAGKLGGLVLNVGAGEDEREFGRRTVRLDRYAPGAGVRGDLGSALPFAPRTFDAAVCTEVLEHVPDASLVLAEIARVLKPGGTVVVTVPFACHYHPDPVDYRRFTPAGLALALEGAGFTVEFCGGIGGKLLLLVLWCDSLHMAARIPVRALTLPFAAILKRLQPANGRWSDWSANAVAVARLRS
jgi:SAM-dependent methyltransferase